MMQEIIERMKGHARTHTCIINDKVVRKDYILWLLYSIIILFSHFILILLYELITNRI